MFQKDIGDSSYTISCDHLQISLAASHHNEDSAGNSNNFIRYVYA